MANNIRKHMYNYHKKNKTVLGTNARFKNKQTKRKTFIKNKSSSVRIHFKSRRREKKTNNNKTNLNATAIT